MIIILALKLLFVGERVTVVLVLCKRCGPSRPSHQLACSVYWSVAFAAFISIDLAVGEAFIGGRSLLEGGV